ncbi:hypothetical protein OJ996_17600 [Luteolibacter sp. GHJ8]|uniref:DUF1570 domain-containing protein n=1 Tax=Luteolibacter rhizosphaerae TaxID=2989719 RepID=A0ABT3G7H3_9BACT|nr:hypothetical protein [Luteolibacter rhizosphaerae]MCW1915404.1 hypothetical protein [Luteolibacter rhizosphaerae]
MRLFPCLLLIAHAVADPLPPRVEPQAAVTEAQPEEAGRKVWHTRFFRIDSDLEIRPNDLASLAQVADTTATVLKAHPLPFFAPPRGQRSRISIHADAADYVRAGGFHGTAGFYVASQAEVLLRGDFFTEGPEKRLLPPHYDEDILVHELVHLCMHRVNPRLPQWLIEGIAEYFACVHQGGGRFSFADIDHAVRDHLRSRLSPDDPSIPLVPVADIAAIRGRGWLRYVEGMAPEDRYQAYATALLLAHYQIHGGQLRMAALRKHLENDGAPALLVPEDSFKIQEALTRFWKSKRLTLEFAKSS